MAYASRRIRFQPDIAARPLLIFGYCQNISILPFFQDDFFDDAVFRQAASGAMLRCAFAATTLFSSCFSVFFHFRHRLTHISRHFIAAAAAPISYAIIRHYAATMPPPLIFLPIISFSSSIFSYY
jgi:hypothetical protein